MILCVHFMFRVHVLGVQNQIVEFLNCNWIKCFHKIWNVGLFKSVWYRQLKIQYEGAALNINARPWIHVLSRFIAQKELNRFFSYINVINSNMTDCLEASYKLMTVVATTRRWNTNLSLTCALGTKNYHGVEVLVYLGTVRGTSTHTFIILTGPCSGTFLQGSFTLPETDSYTDSGFWSHSFSWHLGLDSEADAMQCENFCIVQCSHWVWCPNPSPNPAV